MELYYILEKKYGQKEQTWNEGILKDLVYKVFSISQHLDIETLVNFNHKLYFKYYCHNLKT